MTVGEIIRKRRNEIGLTQKELGKRLNVSQQMIGQYENNSSNLKLSTIMRIGIALGVKLDYFLFGTEDFNIEPGVSLIFNQDTHEIEQYKNELISESEPRDTISTADIQEHKLLSDYRQLNDNGKTEAIKRVEELTEIPRYTEPDEPPEE